MGNACAMGGPNYIDEMAKEAEDKNKYGVRGNMVRTVTNRDVFQYYKAIRILGEGSMGTVSEVRRRRNKSPNQAKEEHGKKGSMRRSVVDFFTRGGGGKNGGGSGDDDDDRTSSPSTKQQKEGKNNNNNAGAGAATYALKTIILDRVSDLYLDELRNEIDILRTLDHPNIVRAYETYENHSRIFVVMELCSGGDLYERTPYTEKEAAKIVTKLLSAISYMHNHGVVHRDLKYENIMFESRRPDAEIKVIDFGLSKKFRDSTKELPPQERIMTEGVGTIYTMSPQVLQGVYTYKADLWSVGVISYMLLSSTKPFWGKRRRQIVDKIMRCRYTFDGPTWKYVSPQAKTFVRSLLEIDPNKRWDADQALKCEWLSKEYNLSDRRPDESLLVNVKESIVNYADSSEFRKLTLVVLACKAETSDLLKLREAFDQYDSSNDGIITIEEFKAAVNEFNFSDEELNNIFAQVDVAHNGHVMYTEFIAATLEARGTIKEEDIRTAFIEMDTDNSGFISRENLREVLGKSYSKESVDQLMKEADLNCDGKIKYNEFLAVFRAQRRQEIDDACSTLKLEGQSDGDDEELLDENAVIPGGKHDQMREEEDENEGAYLTAREEANDGATPLVE